MQNSGSGAQVVRKPCESSASAAARPRPSVSKPSTGPTPRWSGSLHELAARKQKRNEQPARPASPSPPTTAPSEHRDPPTIVVSEKAAEPSSPLGAFRRQWKNGGRWQVPCWLTSFVLHMLAIVVLGSLTVPVSNQRTVVALLLNFCEVNSPDEDGAVELATTISLDTIHEDPLDGSASPGPNALEESEGHMPAAPSAPIIQTALAFDDSAARLVVRQAMHGFAASVGPSAAGQGVKETPFSNNADPVNDEIVARFIEFDVGRLRGAEGQKARVDFNHLGKEAIASLIRGLNKSAKMQASCPVMVISQKVGTLLHENPDPALLRYALDNIGREVRPGAPHLDHLQSLISRLRALDPSYSSLNLPLLMASLKSRDVQGAIQAANVVSAEANKLVEFEKEEIAWALIQLLTHRDADLRAAARRALISLSQGTDWGPKDDRRPADRVAAACNWSLELCPDRFEAAAESMLNTAQNLAEAGKREAARRSLRKLMHEYAGTSAADEAAQRLRRPADSVFE